MGDAKSSLGDGKSSLGDAQSLLGDVYRQRRRPLAACALEQIGSRLDGVRQHCADFAAEGDTLGEVVREVEGNGDAHEAALEAAVAELRVAEATATTERAREEEAEATEAEAEAGEAAERVSPVEFGQQRLGFGTEEQRAL
jgi:hypothetical protein